MPQKPLFKKNPWRNGQSIEPKAMNIFPHPAIRSIIPCWFFIVYSFFPEAPWVNPCGMTSSSWSGLKTSFFLDSRGAFLKPGKHEPFQPGLH
jgi:hypothetical protein